ncbi:methyltransferase domain-containing protein [Ferrovibrio sp.]|uniref:RsmB/NOP family class I SAM-dependent RNA methyltransferase n=1 Tax=Ferrovibrio sp. TaxID=1917215 RepID=UPI003D2A2936
MSKPPSKRPSGARPFSASKTGGKSGGKSGGKPAGKFSGKPAGKTGGKPAGKAGAKSGGWSGAKPGHKPGDSPARPSGPGQPHPGQQRPGQRHERSERHVERALERIEGRPDRSERPSRSDRPERAERAGSAERFGKPRFNKERPDKPRPDKTRFDGPRSDGPRSDRPRSDRPRTDWPRSDRPRSDRPHSDRSDADRRGPDQWEAGNRGYEKRGFDKRGPERRDPERRDPDRRGLDRRDSDRAGAEKPQQRPPHKIRPGSSRAVIAGAVQLLTAIVDSGEPGDRVLHAWMKANHRRFDAAERSALVNLVEEVQRQRGRIDWWLARSGEGKVAPGNDLRVAAWRILAQGAKADGAVASLGLAESEVEPMSRLLRPLEGHTLEHPEMPAVARHNLPPWIEPRFRARFGADFDLEMAAMMRPAPLDLRVNLLKTTRDAALGLLNAAGMRAQATPLSPTGLRLGPQAYVNNTEAFAEGLIEPQDEGSQLAALLAEAQGAKLVMDFCAGAGGKSLAIGAVMRNNGRLIACDVSEKRLARAKLRLRRAGVHNAECRPLEAKWLKRQAGKADRVLVDAPCSGTGTWRRKPDARWRLSENDIVELTQRQAEILERAARLVAPGGRLIYVTCSVLAEENEAQIAAFLKGHGDFTPLPVADIWSRTIGGPCPTSDTYLRLTPGRNGTDGFFVAILEKQG